MRVMAIASGSSGNATLITTPQAKVLIDAGISTKLLESSLLAAEVKPSELSAILLTHEHSDHVASAGIMSRRYGVPIIGNENTIRSANLGKIAFEVMCTGTTIGLQGLSIHSFPLPHDGVETVGYVIEDGLARLCLATDLGQATVQLTEYMHQADLVILEANHDPDTLRNGPYPWFLKSRISGARGHMSNYQAADCIVSSASQRMRQLWLAHLSETNNTPGLALATVSGALKDAGIDHIQVEVALRHGSNLTWNSTESLSQLPLA